MTRSDERSAGTIALITVLPLVTSLVAIGGGPASTHPNGIAAWATSHGLQARIAALAWAFAMLGIVMVAIRLRDVLISSFAERWWAGMLLVQGATVFAAVSVVVAGTTWAVADLGGRAVPDAATVSALWTLRGALLTFACWGLIVPVVAVGRALLDHSLVGQIAAVLGFAVAAVLLVPPVQQIGLYVFAGWLTFTGLALVTRGRRDAPSPDELDAREGRAATDGRNDLEA